MSGNRFEIVFSDLKFTDKTPPSFLYELCRFRYMINSGNFHTQINFLLYWILCLEESMSVWINKFTCPGFVFFPCKTHPKGNGYHAICCGEIIIIYGLGVVDGNNHTIQMDRSEFDTSINMKMFGLII